MGLFSRLFGKSKSSNISNDDDHVAESQKFVSIQETAAPENRTYEGKVSNDTSALMEGDTLKYEYAKMLKYLNKFSTGEPNDYVIERFGERIRTIGKDFVEMGFLRISDAEEKLKMLKVPDLKNMLKDRSLKISGTKGELVQRILDAYTKAELDTILTESVYLLTEEGNKQIQKNEIFFLNDYHRYEFSMIQLKKQLVSHPDAAPNDIFYLLLSQRAMDSLKNSKPQSYAYDCRRLAELAKMRSEYKESIIFAWKSFYTNLSGLSNSNYVYRYYEDEHVDIRQFDEVINLLGWSMDEFRVFMKETAFKQTPNLVFSYYSADTMLQIICDTLENGAVDLKTYPHNIPKKNSKDYTYYGE